jgi:hypothetical protein
MKNMISDVMLLAECFLSKAALLSCRYLIEHLIFYLFFTKHKYVLLAKIFLSAVQPNMAWTVAYIAALAAGKCLP